MFGGLAVVKEAKSDRSLVSPRNTPAHQLKAVCCWGSAVGHVVVRRKYSRSRTLSHSTSHSSRLRAACVDSYSTLIGNRPQGLRRGGWRR